MAHGPSSLITTAPVLAFSACASGQVTLDLTSIPTNAAAVTIVYRARTSGAFSVPTERTATGTFTITGLTDGETYDFYGIPQETGGEVGPLSAPVHVVLSGGLSVFGLEELMDTMEDIFTNMVWPGSATPVFGESVHQVSDPTITQDELAKIQMPGVLIYEAGESGAIADEDPSFTVLRVGVTVLTMVHGDLFGTKALKGGNRDSETVSEGAGLYDLHDAVMANANKTLRNGTYPVRFLSKFASVAGSARVDNSKHLASKAYTFLVALKEQ